MTKARRHQWITRVIAESRADAKAHRAVCRKSAHVRGIEQNSAHSKKHSSTFWHARPLSAGRVHMCEAANKAQHISQSLIYIRASPKPNAVKRCKRAKSSHKSLVTNKVRHAIIGMRGRMRDMSNNQRSSFQSCPTDGSGFHQSHLEDSTT